MFTGLIETKAKVIANNQTEVGYRLVIEASLAGLEVGESIAVNGVCLTLLSSDHLLSDHLLSDHQQLAFDLSPETSNLTSLGDLDAGDEVNIERAMLATARFGGHYVSGHVDTTAQVLSITPVGEYVNMTIGDFLISPDKYLLPKGSIALDGVSLTINKVKNSCIDVMLVPHTLEMTTLKSRQVGQRLNVEFDYFTRIVVHQLQLINGD